MSMTINRQQQATATGSNNDSRNAGCADVGLLQLRDVADCRATIPYATSTAPGKEVRRMGCEVPLNAIA